MRNQILMIAAALLSACSLDEEEMRKQARGEATEPHVVREEPSYPPNADIEACEAFIRSGVEVPESFKRLSLTRRDRPITVESYAAMLGELGSIPAIRDNIELRVEANGGLQLREVTIESIADDYAGPRIRRTDTCRFTLFGGELRLSDDLPNLVKEAQERRQFRQLVADGLIRGLDLENLAPRYSVGCCLPH